ncbi:MULE transposase domain containing protein [Nitzschia inconspicua]|uniref:MULE transposase domain containing protein n=1 Tax=Nitzschia inconspicua TaxID=303405 RepID=A0A9K3LWL0_9STRA|nr:MULE transposase domain containing protein [Nitzschia inconspicua]
MSEEEKKLARECSQLHFTSTSTASLLNIRNALGVAHTRAQMDYVLRRERITQLEVPPSATNAGQLVKSFSGRTDVCWAMMTFNPEVGVLLQATVKDRKEQMKLDRDENEYQRFRQLHHQNKLSSSQKMLLIFLFATVEEMRLLQMHPESISCDVTFGTENTKKQLFTLATRDGNNKAFNCGRAYIPNGQAWVFWHCFRHCLKVFWGETITNRVSLMCTDGDVQEYQPFINNTGEGQTFPNAVHTLCYFHTATISFNNNISFPKGTGKEAMDDAIEVVRWFVKSWFFEVESFEEYNHSRLYLDSWLERGGGSVLEPHIVNSLKTWVTTHLRPLEKMWLNYAVTKRVSMTMFAVRWHSQFQHYYGRDGAEDWTEVFDMMMAEEFERDHSNGECIYVHGMDFLSQKPESWLSIEDDNNEMVIQAKHLHQLTWIQKRVVVKGLPLPELHATDGARESTFEDDCEVECQIPDTIKNLQLSQRNAVTSLREKRNAGNAQVREMVRTALNLADQGTAYTEILLDHLQEAIHQISHAIASGKPNQKRGSEYAFPETGRSKQRVEKRKKSTGEF